MIVIKTCYCFQLNNNFVITHKIGLVCVVDYLSFICNLNILLALIRYAAHLEFFLHCILIDLFNKAITQDMMNLLHSTPNIEPLFFVYNFIFVSYHIYHILSHCLIVFYN